MNTGIFANTCTEIGLYRYLQHYRQMCECIRELHMSYIKGSAVRA